MLIRSHPGTHHLKGFEITNNSSDILKSIKHLDDFYPVEHMDRFGGWNEMNKAHVYF